MTDEQAKELAEKHWEWLIPIITDCRLSVELIRYLYITAMTHGIKHERKFRDDRK